MLQSYFNSRPHGGRPDDVGKYLYACIFQLTPSRRATATYRRRAMRISHFNSRPHGGRQHRAKKVRTRMNISTHALTEGDTFLVILILHFFHFNSRPHGGRPDLSTLCLSCQIFQLTPSRRATAGTPCTCPTVLFQLTPSRRATQDGLVSGYLTGFQLTPSRRATSFLVLFYLLLCISTHALTEGDGQFLLQISRWRYFNSRPHGGRRLIAFLVLYLRIFQLTPSRRATSTDIGWKY